jgi:hypothetical protein
MDKIWGEKQKLGKQRAEMGGQRERLKAKV